MQCTTEEQLSAYLTWALEEVDDPAMFVVFHDQPEGTQVVLDMCKQVTRSVTLLDLQRGGDLEASLLAERTTGTSSEIDVIAGAFSSLTERERYTLNARRDRVLDLARKLVFVEPSSKKAELVRALPDVFSCVRTVFELMPSPHRSDDLIERDHLFDTGNAGRLSTLAATLPKAITRGSTLVIGGKVHFKSPPTIDCPRCGQRLTRGTTEIVFQFAPKATHRQAVDAWVCACGEAYVPGPIARAAYLKAFDGK